MGLQQKDISQHLITFAYEIAARQEPRLLTALGLRIYAYD